MSKYRLISYLFYILVIFSVGLLYNINSPDFHDNFNGVSHISYTLKSSLVTLLILLITDIIKGNFFHFYVFRRDKIGSFVLLLILYSTYFIFPNVKYESLLLWSVVIIVGETFRHLYLYFRLLPDNE